MKLQGMQAALGAYILVPLHQVSQVLAERHEAEQQKNGHQMEMISTSRVLLPILVQSRNISTPEQVASACLALCPPHPCSALPIMLSLSRGVSICNLLLQAPQCLSMCFHNHIRDTRGLADHISGQERLERSRWLQLMQISHRSRPYLIPCHRPELFIS